MHTPPDGTLMATLTAQILIGREHPHHGGINPSHYLFLSENSRPAWVLVKQNVSEDQRDRRPRIIWIPTVNHMLEDALIMTAIHIIRDPDLTAFLSEHHPSLLDERVELYKVTDESERAGLYAKCHNIPEWPKLCISVFSGTSIMKQLGVVGSYPIRTEVCTPAENEPGW